MGINPKSLIPSGPIRFAVVGCGRIAKNHFLSLKQHQPHAELTALCETDEKCVQSLRQEFSVPVFQDLGALLNSGLSDVASICTPSGLHAEQSIQCLKAGLHVVTEKPMATHWQDGLAMVRAAEENGRYLFVVKQNRLNPTIQLVKEALRLNRFGKIFMVTVNVFWTRPQDYYDQAPWRGTWALDGGAFMNQASHYVDLLDYLVGPVRSVASITGTLARQIEAEDTGAVAFQLAGGGIGSMNVTMLTYPKNLEGSITIIGEKGTARIGGLAVNEIQHWEFSEPHGMDEKIHQSSYETKSVYGVGHPLYYGNVIEALRGQAKPLTDGSEGLRSLELLVAIYRSARTKSLVTLPLERESERSNV